VWQVNVLKIGFFSEMSGLEEAWFFFVISELFPEKDAIRA